jgi:hypothetical protein
MLLALIHVLVIVVIAVVVWYVIKLLATQFGFPPLVVQLIGLILGLIVLVYALQAFVPGFRFP